MLILKDAVTKKVLSSLHLEASLQTPLRQARLVEELLLEATFPTWRMIMT